MAIKRLQYSIHFLVSIIGPTMVGPGENSFQSEGSQMTGKRYSDINFCTYSEHFL